MQQTTRSFKYMMSQSCATGFMWVFNKAFSPSKATSSFPFMTEPPNAKNSTNAQSGEISSKKKLTARCVACRCDKQTSFVHTLSLT